MKVLSNPIITDINDKASSEAFFICDMRNKDVIIRLAKLEDMESVQKIYAPYVLNTAITFEYDVPSVTEFENRYAAIVQQYPFLVAERAEEVVGYAYAGSFIER